MWGQSFSATSAIQTTTKKKYLILVLFIDEISYILKEYWELEKVICLLNSQNARKFLKTN